MDRKYIEDNHVVARFLADQLSDSDREAFEAFCLANPEMFREIEATARFKVGLAKLADSRQLQPLLQEAPGSRPYWLRHAAVVAGLLVGGTLIYGAMVSLRVPVMGATVAEVSGRFRERLPVVAVPALLNIRGTEPIEPIVTLPARPSAIEFRVLPEEEGAKSYHAELRRIGNGSTTVATVEELEADEEHFVTFFVSSAKLVPGKYEVMVAPTAHDLSEDTGLGFSVSTSR